MKPDTPNPGQVNASPEKSNLEAQPRESDLSRSESAPQPGSSSPSQDSNQPVAPPNDTSAGSDRQPAVTAQSDNSQGGFQASIAQLPAEDTENIESEWVDKADEIEQKTSTDPYHEDDAQHELSRAYLKKRFGMDIK
jgi:hypothetical protein